MCQHAVQQSRTGAVCLDLRDVGARRTETQLLDSDTHPSEFDDLPARQVKRIHVL
jgi:hypothetical protein